MEERTDVLVLCAVSVSQTALLTRTKQRLPPPHHPQRNAAPTCARRTNQSSAPHRFEVCGELEERDAFSQAAAGDAGGVLIRVRRLDELSQDELQQRL